MELLVKVQDDKAAHVAELVEKMAFVEAVEIKLPPSAAELDDDFLSNLREAISDAENPEDAFQGVLQGLREVEAAQRGEIKLQSMSDFLKELRVYRDKLDALD